MSVFRKSRWIHEVPLHDPQFWFRWTVNCSQNHGHSVFAEEAKISHGLWLPSSPHMRPCCYYFWEALKKIDFIWKLHILCKNWNIILDKKFVIIQHNKSSAVCWECFQNMRGMLSSYRSALQGSLCQVEFWRKKDSKLPPRADIPCH
jgi:hypothetical protein